MHRRIPLARATPRRRPVRRLHFDPLELRAVPSAAAEFAAAFPLGGADGTVTVRKAIAGYSEGPVVVGSFTGTVDFDPGPGVFNLTSAGGEDAFVARYDRMGRLQWAQRFGGEGDDRANDVIAPYNGDVTVVGSFSGTVTYRDHVTWYEFHQIQSEGGTDAFVLAMSPYTEGEFRYVRSFGGAGDDEANGLAYSSYGDMVIVGSFSGTANFDPYYRLAGSPHTLTSAGGTDAFLLSIGMGASWWEPSSVVVRAGGPGDDAALAVNWDRSGGDSFSPGNGLPILGTFTGTADLSFEDGLHVATFYTREGPDYRTSAGGRDVFVARVVGGSIEPVFLKTFGGPGDERPTALTIVNEGATAYSQGHFYYYVAGAFEGEARFDDGAAGGRVSAGGSDGFLARYDAHDGALDWVATLAGPGDDSVEVIVSDSTGVSATGGFTGGLDFDPGAGATVLQGGAAGSAFLWRLTGDGALDSARAFGGGGSSRGLGLTYVGWDEFFVAVRFAGPVDFDPGPKTSLVASTGASDGFFAKFQTMPDMLPIAGDDMYRVTAGQELAVQRYDSWGYGPIPGGLLVNDRTRRGTDSGVVQRLTFTKGGYFTVWEYSGAFSYEPVAGFAGVDSFTYQLRDGDLLSNVATVSFDVVPAGPAPAARSDHAVDLGTGGVWSWSAVGGWAQVSTLDAEGVATGPDGRIYLDLGPRGLWSWADGGYRKINEADPQAIVAGPDGSLAVDYGPYGLWTWSGDVVSRLNAADPEGAVFAPDGSLYVDYGRYGLWAWRRGAGFRQVNAADPEGLAAGPGGVLYVDFGPFGLWDYRDGRGFLRLNDANARSLAVAADGTLLADFGPYGLWARRELSGFVRLNAAAPRRMALGSSGVLYVDFGAEGYSRWLDGGLSRIAHAGPGSQV
ncbi:MAG: hypothetical protein BGO49_04720 [Planctomycetales bacterium 71-10]|nr:MAG: hypothetical protein BGO49_04720 [Planctomycetales bacterium 71-10]